MHATSLSLLSCVLLVACIARPPHEAEPIEPSVRWDSPSALVEAGAGGATLSAPVGGAGGVVEGAAEPVSSAGAGGLFDGPRRPAPARGRWYPIDPSSWKGALEDYAPSVRQGNLIALNTARQAFAEYLIGMHKRIHPIFTDSFLSSLDHLPATQPMNDPRLSTELEIILNQETGGIARMGVTKSSGLTAFDVAVLASVKRAAPFGAPPREIQSPDGKVYVHWVFHRSSAACSTFNVRPFMLKTAPPSPSVEPVRAP